MHALVATAAEKTSYARAIRHDESQGVTGGITSFRTQRGRKCIAVTEEDLASPSGTS